MRLLGLTLSLFLFLSFSLTALAQTTAEPTPQNRLDVRKDQLQEIRQKMQDRIEQAREKAQNRIEQTKEKRQAKLDERKLKVCQTKEKVLSNRLGSLNRMSQNMLEKFEAITTRVKDFYTNKVVPAGGFVSSFDALVADIDAKKAAVDTALASAKANSESFSCDGDDPKGALTNFRTDMQTVKTALHDYRISINNLIVAVRGAAGVLRASPSSEKAE